jgi:uncharacterized protein YjbI with pentapeptide repeats
VSYNSVAREQLAQAESLRGVTLPDGTQLSEDNWKAEFAEWCEEQEERDELIDQLASDVRHLALQAAGQLRERGWLSDGSLHSAFLEEANLEGADLEDGVLPAVSFQGANLVGADLWFVQLEGADLEGADLRDARLKDAMVAAEQLARAASLAGATLPDGTRLSEANWRAEFEAWRRKQEERESDD